MPLLSASYLVIASFYIVRWAYQYSWEQEFIERTGACRNRFNAFDPELKHITSVTREIKVFLFIRDIYSVNNRFS